VNVRRAATRTERIDVFLYAAAAVTYIGFGLYNKWLLDWIIGPLWLLAWMQVVPALGRRFRRRSDARSARGADPSGPAA